MEWWIAATLPLYLWGGVLKFAWKRADKPNVVWLWNWIQERNIFSTASRIGTRRIPYKSLDNIPESLLRIRYNIQNWDQLLLQDLIEWKIYWDKATRLIQRWNKDWAHLEWKRGNSISEFVQKMIWKDAASMSGANIDILLNNKWDIAFMRNPKLREMFFDWPSITAADRAKSVRDWCLRKTYKPIWFPNKIWALKDFMVWVGGKNSIYETLSTTQKKFAKQILETGEFNKIEEVEAFVHNVKNYNLDRLDDSQISHLAEELGKHTDDLGDATKINSKIDNMIEAKLAEKLKNNAHYKKIIDDLNLEESRIRARGESIAGKNQLDNISDFKKALTAMDDAELERTAVLLWEFKKWWNVWDAISQLTVLRKLEGKIIDTVDDAGNPIKKSIDDIIKNLDIKNLKKCKWLWISDEALDSLVETFEAIHKIHIQKSIWSADEILQTVKVLFKLVAKAT